MAEEITEKVVSESKGDFVPKHDDYQYPLLEDVAGDSKLKNSLEDIVLNIAYPNIFKFMGIKPDKSFVFRGPPGTGKTFSLKAVRNELIDKEIEIAYMPYSIGEYGTAYINMGAKLLNEFFKAGRGFANKGQTVIYWFDEADTLMNKRGSIHSHKEDDKLLNTLMTNLQDINSNGDREYAFFATNFFDAMDAAAVRSGRIDRVIDFNMPSLDALAEAYSKKINLINKKSNDSLTEIRGPNDFYVIPEVCYKTLAKQSEGFNFADVDAVVEKAVRRRTLEFLRAPDKKIEEPPKVSMSYLTNAIKDVKGEQHTNPKRCGFCRE